MPAGHQDTITSSLGNDDVCLVGAGRSREEDGSADQPTDGPELERWHDPLTGKHKVPMWLDSLSYIEAVFSTCFD